MSAAASVAAAYALLGGAVPRPSLRLTLTSGLPVLSAPVIAAATIYVWAIDPNLPNDERANYEAVDKLRMKVRVALHKAGAGRIWIGKYQRVVSSNERPFGFEWKVTIGIKEEDIDVLHANVQVIRDPNPTIVMQLPAPAGP